MAFISSYSTDFYEDRDVYIFCFNNSNLAVVEIDGTVKIPRSPLSALSNEQRIGLQYIGTIDSVPCCACVSESITIIGKHQVTMKPLRTAFTLLSPDQLEGALLAVHIANWDKATRFCGRCGQPTRLSNTERAKLCTVCEYTGYPKISPAVIVAVIKDRQILLGHSSRFHHTMYSVVAGFVDPGETLETCVAREVLEETGISVKNIRYFGSQPWPFPDSLMIGFTAEYAGGEISVDGKELTSAAWFSADALPHIPDRISIARQLIDWFSDRYA